MVARIIKVERFGLKFEAELLKQAYCAWSYCAWSRGRPLLVSKRVVDVKFCSDGRTRLQNIICTWHSSIHRTVKGTSLPHSSHSCVIPALMATSPVRLQKEQVIRSCSSRVMYGLQHYLWKQNLPSLWLQNALLQVVVDTWCMIDRSCLYPAGGRRLRGSIFPLSSIKLQKPSRNLSLELSCTSLKYLSI